MDDIKFNTHLALKSYIKLQYELFYGRIWVVLFTLMGLCLLLYGLYLLIMGDYESFPIIPFAIGFVATVYFPFIIWRNSKKNYQTNRTIQEQIRYCCTETELEVFGESFTSKISLKNIHRIKDFKNWILIYQSENTMYVLPKSDMTGEQISQLIDRVNREKR